MPWPSRRICHGDGEQVLRRILFSSRSCLANSPKSDRESRRCASLRRGALLHATPRARLQSRKEDDAREFRSIFSMKVERPTNEGEGDGFSINNSARGNRLIYSISRT